MLELSLNKSDDSYSKAAMERMFDEISVLVKRLNGVGSALATLNLFHRESVEIEGKRRMLRDFVVVDLGPDPTVGTFRVVIHNPATIPATVAILKENGFINIDTSDRRSLKVVKPRLTVQQEEDLENEIGNGEIPSYLRDDPLPAAPEEKPLGAMPNAPSEKVPEAPAHATNAGEVPPQKETAEKV